MSLEKGTGSTRNSYSGLARNAQLYLRLRSFYQELQIAYLYRMQQYDPGQGGVFVTSCYIYHLEPKRWDLSAFF